MRSRFTQSEWACVQTVKTQHIACVISFVYDNEVCMPSQCMSRGVR